jgi:hypothetical protein
MEDACEHGNKSSRSVKFCEILEQLRNWLLLKKDSAPVCLSKENMLLVLPRNSCAINNLFIVCVCRFLISIKFPFLRICPCNIRSVSLVPSV